MLTKIAYHNLKKKKCCSLCSVLTTAINTFKGPRRLSFVKCMQIHIIYDGPILQVPVEC